MALKILKYTLLISGSILIIIGFIQDYDILTFSGVALIIVPFFIFYNLKKSIK